MARIVLDSSAVLAVVHGEPGAEMVAANLPGGVISAANLAEVASHLSDKGVSENDIREVVGNMGLDVAIFDAEQAYAVGVLRPLTRQFGLSLGDRACLTLATARNLPVLTADRQWLKLDTGVEVQLIR